MVRLVSAAVLIAALAAILWVLPPAAMALAAALVAALAAIEVASLARKVAILVHPPLVAFAASIVTVAFAFDEQGSAVTDGVLAAVLLSYVVASGAAALLLTPPTPASFSSAAVAMLAPIYVGIPIGAILSAHWTFGPAATTWLIATIAISDSAQYYTGRSLGRRKLAPAISPAKTVEGAIGGLVAATIGGAWLGSWAVPSIGMAAAAGLSLALAGAGILGDLFESLLKRSVGAKDSSALIPGHGGVLDRIDSYLFAAPVFYLVLRFITR